MYPDLTSEPTIPLSSRYHETVLITGAGDPRTPEYQPEGLPERYVLRRKLGQGGTGLVYLAYDQQVGRLVAIKWLPRPLTDAVDSGCPFGLEARLMGRLNHPNITALYDWGGTEKGSYLVLEYCPGTDLQKWVQDGGPWSQSQVRKVLSGLVQALDYAHRQGVIHGDIKPANILLDQSGNVKLTDFGAGRWRQCRRADVWATPSFAAPELSRDGLVTAASDVYSLAASAVYLLTGEVLRASPDQVPDQARYLLAEKRVTWDLTNVLVRSLAPNPADRPGIQQWATVLADTQPSVATQVPLPCPSVFDSYRVSREQTGGEAAQRVLLWVVERGLKRVLFWQEGRVIYAVQAGLWVYLVHNVQVARNLLFPVLSAQVRQVILPAGTFFLTLVNLRLGVTVALWSLLPVLFREILGWALVYGFTLLLLTPVVQFAPRVVLQVLLYPVLSLHWLRYGAAMAAGRYFGGWKGLAVGAVGQFLTFFLLALSQTPFMGQLLQYGLIRSEPGLGIGASIGQGLLPALSYSLSWPQTGVILSCGLAGLLAGTWRARWGAELLLASGAIGFLVILLHITLALSVPWEQLIVGTVVLNIAGLVEWAVFKPCEDRESLD